MDKPAFTVITPAGHKFQVFDDGRAEGFPEGSVVVNRIPVKASHERAQAEQQSMAATF